VPTVEFIALGGCSGKAPAWDWGRSLQKLKQNVKLLYKFQRSSVKKTGINKGGDPYNEARGY